MGSDPRDKPIPGGAFILTLAPLLSLQSRILPPQNLKKTRGRAFPGGGLDVES